MGGWRGYCLAVALAGVLVAQDPLAEVREALAAGRSADAARAFTARVAGPAPGSERAARLSEGIGLFRSRGASSFALQALDAAIAARPGEPVLRYYRGALRRDLKLLRGAREDLLVALEADGGRDELERELAGIEALDFRHEAAAELYRAAGATDLARREARVVASLVDARPRQILILLGGLAVLGGLGMWVYRAGRRT